MAHRVSPRAEIDLDEIWYYVAKESSSIEIANHLIDTITDRFFMLSGFPYIGRSREELGPGCRSVAVGEYVIVYCVENGDILVLRVVHGRRDFEMLFGL
ncbi:MAG TPA: type II toxin-antitoxin system RelE/ParE family toxin [Bryobacteraceae bacterium]|nr:type II toxin-antitoxin system RelE/ParE family toxin [Bryobacteraceae bacterium]